MHPLIIQNRKAIQAVCQAFGVRRLDVFGSAARSDDFDSKHSDVDFLLDVGSGREAAFSITDFLDLRQELSEILGHPVDLVMEGSIRNPYRLADIQQSREIVHAA
jgi:predicted nucleotidyltransferase